MLEPHGAVLRARPSGVGAHAHVPPSKMALLCHVTFSLKENLFSCYYFYPIPYGCYYWSRGRAHSCGQFMVTKCFVWRSQDPLGGMAGGQCAWHALTLSTTGVGQNDVSTNSDCVVFMLTSVSRSAVFIRISVDLDRVSDVILHTYVQMTTVSLYVCFSCENHHNMEE